jgi:hypothetical protein
MQSQKKLNILTPIYWKLYYFKMSEYIWLPDILYIFGKI